MEVADADKEVSMRNQTDKKKKNLLLTVLVCECEFPWIDTIRPTGEDPMIGNTPDLNAGAISDRNENRRKIVYRQGGR